METSGDFISTVTEIWKAIRQSMTFSLLLGFLAVYSLVLFLDIVLLFFLRPFRADMKKGRFGTKERPFASERVLLRRWQEIESRLLSRSKSGGAMAILEADSFVDQILSEMGYHGKDFGERLDAIPPGHFTRFPDLRAAHEIRNRIVLDSEFSIDRPEAVRVLSLYRGFLEELEVLPESSRKSSS